jgi:hypothetical protein
MWDSQKSLTPLRQLHPKMLFTWLVEGTHTYSHGCRKLPIPCWYCAMSLCKAVRCLVTALFVGRVCVTTCLVVSLSSRAWLAPTSRDLPLSVTLSGEPSNMWWWSTPSSQSGPSLQQQTAPLTTYGLMAGCILMTSFARYSTTIPITPLLGGSRGVCLQMRYRSCFWLASLGKRTRFGLPFVAAMCTAIDHGWLLAGYHR